MKTKVKPEKMELEFTSMNRTVGEQFWRLDKELQLTSAEPELKSEE